MNEGVRVIVLRGHGEMFVSEQNNEDGNMYFRDPMMMVPVQTENGTSIQLQQWFGMANFDRKKGIVIQEQDIMFNEPAIDDLVNAYNMTRNPVQQASSAMLPENQNGVDPSDMTGEDGLRLIMRDELD